MKKLLALCLIGGSCFAGTPTQHITTVEEIQPSGNCLYFTLTDVTPPNPVRKDGRFFAIPTTFGGYKEAFAIILAAKASGKNIKINATGDANSNCLNWAEVTVVAMP